MALNKPALIDQLVQMMEDMHNYNISEGATPQDARLLYAQKLADAIDTYVKSATVTFNTGTIQVQGSATSQANVVPLIIDNTIS